MCISDFFFQNLKGTQFENQAVRYDILIQILFSPDQELLFNYKNHGKGDFHFGEDGLFPIFFNMDSSQYFSLFLLLSTTKNPGCLLYLKEKQKNPQIQLETSTPLSTLDETTQQKISQYREYKIPSTNRI